jgi:hypothetical protein
VISSRRCQQGLATSGGETTNTSLLTHPNNCTPPNKTKSRGQRGHQGPDTQPPGGSMRSGNESMRGHRPAVLARRHGRRRRRCQRRPRSGRAQALCIWLCRLLLRPAPPQGRPRPLCQRAAAGRPQPLVAARRPRHGLGAPRLRRLHLKSRVHHRGQRRLDAPHRAHVGRGRGGRGRAAAPCAAVPRARVERGGDL